MGEIVQTITLSPEDRVLILDLTAELRRYNDNADAGKDDKLLNVKEAAKVVGVSRQTIAKMVSSNRLHKVMQGGKTGILMSELKRIHY